VATGSLYPTVERLLDAGFITKRQEKDQPGLKRPLRTYYTITEAGRRYIADPDAVMPIGARDGDKLDDLRVVIGDNLSSFVRLLRPGRVEVGLDDLEMLVKIASSHGWRVRTPVEEWKPF